MLLEKLNLKYSWGKLCNEIQNVARRVLPTNEWNDIAQAQDEDANDCYDMDGVLFNGQYFDWKEFETKKLEILKAYLRYYTPRQQQLIEQAM